MTRPEDLIEQKFVEHCKKHKIQALKLKTQGNVGWPDRMVLPGYGIVLFIEFKAPRGRPDPVQEMRHQWLKEQGYNTVVCYSSQEAIDALNFALDIKATEITALDDSVEIGRLIIDMLVPLRETSDDKKRVQSIIELFQQIHNQNVRNATALTRLSESITDVPVAEAGGTKSTGSGGSS